MPLTRLNNVDTIYIGGWSPCVSPGRAAVGEAHPINHPPNIFKGVKKMKKIWFSEKSLLRIMKKLIEILDEECCLYSFTREEVEYIEKFIKHMEDNT